MKHEDWYEVAVNSYNPGTIVTKKEFNADLRRFGVFLSNIQKQELTECDIRNLVNSLVILTNTFGVVGTYKVLQLRSCQQTINRVNCIFSRLSLIEPVKYTEDTFTQIFESIL